MELQVGLDVHQLKSSTPLLDKSLLLLFQVQLLMISWRKVMT